MTRQIDHQLQANTHGQERPLITRPRARRWMLSGTVASNRRNLFDLTPGNEHQVATLVSGSRSQLARFEYELAIIEAAPLMLDYLREVLTARPAPNEAGNNLKLRIEKLIERLDRSDS